MYNWCMAHPWMSFIILIILADSIGYWFHSGKKNN
ncbi:hypothetical protein EZN00_00947 [Clostridium tyrobutyricum]|nr:hypothetical protein EZN00_00947 [Clostridium tyrobutyricum]